MELKRIAVVTLGLIATGAVLGAAAGVVVAVLVVAMIQGPSGIPSMGRFYGVAALGGAAIGAVLGPAASFTMLRRAPLWRVFAETTLGTVLGALVGLALPLHLAPDTAAVAMAVVGFLAAATRLAWSCRRTASGASLPTAP